jgi:uncharacterized protein
MICPACHDEMIVVEYKQIELDFCPGCRGVWFDSDELDLLLDALDFLDLKAKALFRPTPEASDEADRKCPYCRSKMDKALMGSGRDVTIDRCPQGHGLWFDGGELDTVIGSLQKDNKKAGDGDPAGGSVCSFLADMFFAEDSHDGEG